MTLRLLKVLGLIMLSPILLFVFTCALGLSAAYEATKHRAEN